MSRLTQLFGFAWLLFVVWAAAAQEKAVTPTLDETLKARGYFAVPLVKDKHSAWLLVEAKVNGQPAKFVVDTGASVPGLLNSRHAARLKVDIGKETVPAAVVGVAKIAAYAARPKLVELGTVRVVPQDWFVIDLSNVLRSDPKDTDGFDGVIGSALLDYYAAVIDYRGRKLYLQDPVTGREPDLCGEWVGVEITQKGVNHGAKFAETYQFTFANGELKFRSKNLDADYPWVVLDTTTNPRHMDWIMADGSLKYVSYEFRKGQLVIAAPLLQGDDTTGRPSGFGCGLEDKHTLLVMERRPKKK